MAMTRSDIMSQLAEKTESLGYEWIGCDWTGGQANSVLRIYADSPEGIGVDQCAEISRELATLLDVLDAIPHRYVLEVSSPGLSRPLFTPAHFSQQLSKEVKLTLVHPSETGQRQYRGVIDSVDGEAIRLVLSEGEAVTIQHADIEKAKLVAEVSMKGDNHVDK